jgi:hypothetical protein
MARSNESKSVITSCDLSSRSFADEMSSKPDLSASPYLISWGTGMNKQESAARSAVTPIGAEMYVLDSISCPGTVETVR